MIENMKVEFGRTSDIDSWMRLVRKVSWNFPGLETEQSIEEHKIIVLKFMNDKSALCVKNEEDIVGVLLYSRKHNMICCLAVDPAYRKKGIASMLLSEALDKLDRDKDITVSTFRENDVKGIAPRNLYKKFGFEEDELIEEFGYPNQRFVLHADKSVDNAIIGTTVTVTVDRPLGSYHPEYKDMYYLDTKYGKLDYISYYRYVDDILILVNEDKYFGVKKNICNDIKKLGLELNEKKDEGFVTESFEYLGYVLNDSEVTVRKSSVLKIEQSLEELFRTIKKENIGYLQWKLNLKITGFILEKHKYGWLFFYSQITDLSLLFHLDDVVQKLSKRYKLEGKIKIKRFVRTYAEMHMALHETKYIPNLDALKLEDKKAVLSDIYQMDLSDKDENFVEIQFHKIMKREIRDIEKDIENIS